MIPEKGAVIFVLDNLDSASITLAFKISILPLCMSRASLLMKPSLSKSNDLSNLLLSVLNSAFTASNCAKYSELSKDIKIEFFLIFCPSTK